MTEKDILTGASTGTSDLEETVLLGLLDTSYVEETVLLGLLDTSYVEETVLSGLLDISYLEETVLPGLEQLRNQAPTVTVCLLGPHIKVKYRTLPAINC